MFETPLILKIEIEWRSSHPMAEGTCTSCGILGGTMNMQQGVQVYTWKDARGKMLDN
jgi:hypothetical protein